MKKLTLTLTFFFFTLSAWCACSGKEVSYKLSDPVDRTPWTIKANSYRPDVAPGKKFPVVFILPPLGGETGLEHIDAFHFCLAGMGAYTLNVVREFPLQAQIQNMNFEDERLERAQAGVSHVMDVLQKDPDVSGNFGIMGFSQGAIFSAYISGIDKRLKSRVLVVAGGNLPAILAYGIEKEHLDPLREGRMKYYNIPTQEDYEIFLRKYITKDPIDVAPNISPDSTYMFIANHDVTVPTRYQYQLKNRIPSPLVFVMNASHEVGVVKAALIHKHKITRFFLNRLL